MTESLKCILCGDRAAELEDHITGKHKVGSEEALELLSKLSKLIGDQMAEVTSFIDNILRNNESESLVTIPFCKLETKEKEEKTFKVEMEEEEEEAKEGLENDLEISPSKRQKVDSSFNAEDYDPYDEFDPEDLEVSGETKSRGKKGMMGKMDKLALQEPILGESVCPGTDCGKVFIVTDRETERLYRRHVFYHRWKKILRRHGCSCKLNIDKSDSELSTKLHVYREHRGRYHCKKCLKSFWEECDLIEHSHNEPHTKELFVCDDCGYTAESKQRFNYHRSYNHSNQTFVCDICSKVFNNSIRYQQHVRRDHREKNPCTLCGEMIKNMSRHMKTMHTEDRDKKYPCDECGKGFYEITALKSHQMSVHIKARPFPCRFGCGASSNIAGNRNKHEINKHGRKFAPDKERWPKKDL